MKKNTIIIVALVTVLLFSAIAAASAESKIEYYGKISLALTNLKNALGDKDKAAANVALGEVRTHVYAGMRFLAMNGIYDSRAMAIADNANKAYTACFNGQVWEAFLNESVWFNWVVFGEELNSKEYNGPHS